MSPTLKYTVSLLKKYLKSYKLLVFFVAFLLLIFNSIQILNPQIIRLYLKQINAATLNTTALVWTSILYIGVNLIFRGVYVILNWISQELAWSTTNDLRVDLTRHCVNLDMTFHNKHKTGEMIERIDGDASNLSSFFGEFIVHLISNGLLLVGVLIAVFIEGWVFGLAFLAFTLIAFTALYLLRKITAPLWKKVRESTTALYGNIEESISGFEDIQGCGADDYIMKKYHDAAQSDFKNKNKAMIVSKIFVITSVLLEGGLNVGILVLSFFLQNIIPIDAGLIYLLLAYATNLLLPIQKILWQTGRLQNSLANIDRIKDWFDIKSKIKDTGKLNFPKDNIHLVFDDLDFGYNGDELVLKKVTFELEPEKKIGIVGRTGSGKTTLARLIFRLYDPQFGSIKINGYENFQYSLEELRNNIAYVTQDVELFNASVKDNITFFDSRYSDEEIIDVLIKLGLEDWLNRLPNGLETEVYSEELGLSAGEEQLLALARAFLKNPKIVILDEASSRLDPATEKITERALNNLLQNRSAIIIAHRLSTLDKVDKILILEKGVVSEFGRRAELVENPESHFSQLLQKGIMEVLH
ncbi:MAG: ABC transporter ATP-binding protein [Candidatus Heimdallarchaeota archaeon]